MIKVSTRKTDPSLPGVSRSCSQQKLRPLMRFNKNSHFPKDFFYTPSKIRKPNPTLPKLLSSYSQCSIKRETSLPKIPVLGHSNSHPQGQQNNNDSQINQEMNFTFGRMKLQTLKAKSYVNIHSSKQCKPIARDIKTQQSVEQSAVEDNTQNDQNEFCNKFVYKNLAVDLKEVPKKKLKRKALRI